MTEERSGHAGVAPAEEVQPEPRPEKVLRCRACGHALTQERLALEMQGGHEHTFRNPGGWSFHLVLFRDAPGCLEAGTPTSEATWFSGYDWCHALCGGCRGHVGWWYVGADRFVGLIATRLA